MNNKINIKKLYQDMEKELKNTRQPENGINAICYNLMLTVSKSETKERIIKLRDKLGFIPFTYSFQVDKNNIWFEDKIKEDFTIKSRYELIRKIIKNFIAVDNFTDKIYYREVRKGMVTLNFNSGKTFEKPKNEEDIIHYFMAYLAELYLKFKNNNFTNYIFYHHKNNSSLTERNIEILQKLWFYDRVLYTIIISLSFTRFKFDFLFDFNNFSREYLRRLNIENIIPLSKYEKYLIETLIELNYFIEEIFMEESFFNLLLKNLSDISSYRFKKENKSKNKTIKKHEIACCETTRDYAKD